MTTRVEIRKALGLLQTVDEDELDAIAAEDRAQREERERVQAQERDRLAKVEREVPKRAAALLDAYDSAVADGRMRAAEDLARAQLLRESKPDRTPVPLRLTSEVIERATTRAMEG
jgi:hypothetical protein